jgi:murein DD-endopeptidase MepM/ murein hydrolase activator NlpD
MPLVSTEVRCDLKFSPYAQSGPRRNAGPKRSTGKQVPKSRKGMPKLFLVAGLVLGMGIGFGSTLSSPSDENQAQETDPLTALSPQNGNSENPLDVPETGATDDKAKAAAPGSPQSDGTVAQAPAETAPAKGTAAPNATAGAAPRALLPMVSESTVNDRIRQGETLSAALSKHGVAMESVNRLVVALKGFVDMRGIRPGDAYTIVEMGIQGRDAARKGDGGAQMRMDKFIFQPDRRGEAPWKVKATRVLEERTNNDLQGEEKYVVEKETAVLETRVLPVIGEVKSSLYQAMVDRGEGSDLVNRFVDVFAWNIDFYRETQKGDRYKALVEKKYADGRFVGYGRVLAAEYHMTQKVHRGFLYQSDDGKVVGIYDHKGGSLEKTFLKNPLEIARITSRYGQRFHPVLRRHKKHNGVDYGARTGTPFWAVADGVVKEARYSRTAGNMVVLRHINGYETQYFHASRLAPKLRPGVRVKQRQLIGYVGSTGRSTGPHLHFGMKKRGTYVDPGKQIFPAAKPVPRKYVEEYLEKIAPLMAELKALEIS